jgi:site-specific recombinase XerD
MPNKGFVNKLKNLVKDNYKPSTIELYYKCLLKISEYEEEEWQDDIFNKTPDQMEDFLDYQETSTAKSGSVMITALRKYVQWAISEGYSRSNFDFSKMIRLKKIKTHVSINAFKTQYITNQDELWNICNFCANAQDSILFILPYFSIDGVAHKEQTSIQIEDVQDNGININRDGEVKFIEIPERFMVFIRDAVTETTYYKNNDMSEGSKAKSFELAPSNYLLKMANKRGLSTVGEIEKQIINQRIKKIIELFHMRNIKRLNPGSILISGLFDYLKNIENQKNTELDRVDYEEALCYYNINKNLWADYKIKYELFKEVTKNV